MERGRRGVRLRLVVRLRLPELELLRGSLALKGWKLVGADQLIGGPWPDNEPAVSCMDCKKFNGCFLSKCPIKCNRFVKTGSGQTLTCFTQTGVKTN
eukprot:COSAG06_NODE_3476_length_5286_cov_2.649123_2_plen_97_part_00